MKSKSLIESTSFLQCTRQWLFVSEARQKSQTDRQTVGKGNAVFLIEVHDGYYKQGYRQKALVLYRKYCSKCQYCRRLCWPARMPMLRNQSCHFFIQIYLTWGPSWPRVFPSIQSLSLLFIATQITDWFEERFVTHWFSLEIHVHCTIGTENRAQVRPTCLIFEQKEPRTQTSGQPQVKLRENFLSWILNYDGRYCMLGHVKYLVGQIERKQLSFSMMKFTCFSPFCLMFKYWSPKDPNAPTHHVDWGLYTYLKNRDRGVALNCRQCRWKHPEGFFRWC